MNEPNPFQPRATCYACFRPKALCYCTDIRLVNNRTRIVIVQHPREQFHPLNTARIAEMSLSRGEIVRSAPAHVESALQKIKISPQAAILYPSADAEALEELEPGEFPEEVIVLDGTWHHAKTLLRDVRKLGSYRRVRFTPPAPSEYKIRQEPREDYLSTIESVAHVLSVLEPETPGIEYLRTTFRRMIDRNVAARKPSEAGQRHRVRSAQRPHHFPEQLFAAVSQQVVVYCEGTSRFSRDRKLEGQAPQREPLLLMARRLIEGEHDSPFEAWLQTERTPSKRLLEQLCITEHELASRAIPAQLGLAQLREWLRPEDQLVVFNASSGSILQELGFVESEPLQLKGAYCDWALFLEERQLSGKRQRQHKWGAMDEIIARHGMRHNPAVTPGRGPQRIQETLAILDWLRSEAVEHCLKFDN